MPERSSFHVCGYFAFSLVFLVVNLIPDRSFADAKSVMPDFYAEPGLNGWRNQVSTVNEHIDPFSGSLQLSYTDLVIPGNGGLDIRIQRHYTSNIWYSRPNLFSFPPYPSRMLPPGPYGVGWAMHFGRVIKAKQTDGSPDGICETNGTELEDTTLNNAVLELPDGSQEILAVDDGTNISQNTLFVTKRYWLANCLFDGAGSSIGLTLYSPDGLKYTMSHQITAYDQETYSSNVIRAWYPSSIEDGNGNTLNFTYSGQYGTYALIDTISASDGRTVKYGYDIDNYLSSITAFDATSDRQTWLYNYVSVGAVGHKLLESVIQPDSLRWQYQYKPGSAPVAPYALETVTYPYGATSTYTYDHVDFSGNVELTGGTSLDKYYSVVVSTKELGGRNIEPATWSYHYYPGTDDTIEPGISKNDRTDVIFPGGKYEYKHYGLQRQLEVIGGTSDRGLWKTGLLKERNIYQENGAGTYSLVQKEVYEWETRGQISSETYVSPPYNYYEDSYKRAYLASKKIERDGSRYETIYDYAITIGGITSYAVRPRKKIETGQAGTASAYSRTTDLGWYPVDLAQYPVLFFDRLIKEWVSDNRAYSTLRTYDYTTGNLIGLESHGVYTQYSHYPSGDIATKTDANNYITEYRNYHRGIPQQELGGIDGAVAGGAPLVITERVVNNRGTVHSETNGRGITTTYQYDDSDRLIFIDIPKVTSGDVSISWDNTLFTQSVARGAYRQTTHYDGLKRPICVTTEDRGQSPAAISKLTRYDSLGRKAFESQPFTGICPVWTSATPSSIAGSTYRYDALGRTTYLGHSDGTYQSTSYVSGNKVLTTNERGYVTTRTYRSLGDPDNGQDTVVVRIDAQVDNNKTISTIFDRNILGQIENVTQGDVQRRYTYSVDKNFLESVTDPEVGLISYTRDNLGNMKSRTVGASSATYHSYDGLNRLRSINYPGTTPDVSLEYNGNSNLIALSSGITGWIYDYDENDNLYRETLSVDGKTYAIGYEFDSLDFMRATTYPSGLTVAYDPDAIGRPLHAAPFVDAITFHPNGKPARVTYANGKITEITLNQRQWIDSISVTNNLVGLGYQYDGRGNVLNISDAATGDYRTLGYDGIDRLVIANGGWGSGVIGYDDTGNILSKNIGSSANSIDLNYTYDSLTHRLSSITGSRDYNFTYDVYGNITDYGDLQFLYDDAGNLRNVTGSTTAAYVYDGNKRRTREQKNGVTTYNVYAKNGNLIGEYAADGLSEKEYVYLAGQLVAMRKNVKESPVANAGMDQTALEGAAVNLDGTASSDPDGTIAAYQWKQISGPAVTLTSANTASPNFTAPLIVSDDSITFNLTVTDNHGLTSSDSVVVNVLDKLSLSDSDMDGLLDVWEIEHFGNLAQIAIGDLDGDGVTNLQEQAAGTDPNVAELPRPVTEPMARPDNSANNLSWSISNASSYTIYWSNSPGVTPSSGTPITGVSNPFFHPGLTNGVEYYYVITAVNALGESAPSVEVSAMPGHNGWGSIVTLDDTSQNINDPRLAGNDTGHIAMVWLAKQETTRYYNVWARHYDPDSGWKPPVIVSQGTDGTSSGFLDVAINGSGNAITAWQSSDGWIYASHYQSGSSWSSPRAISQTGNLRISPASGGRNNYVSIDAYGNAIVVWPENDLSYSYQGPSYLKTRRFDASTKSWDSIRTLDYVSKGYFFSTNIRADRDGNAMTAYTVWRENPYTYAIEPEIYASRYMATDNQWLLPTALSIKEGTVMVKDMSMNSAGQAALVYTRSAGPETHLDDILARRYDPAIGWHPVESVATSVNATIVGARIHFDGTIYVAWPDLVFESLDDWDGHEQLHAARYIPGQGWKPAALVSEYGNSWSQGFDLELDSQGNAMVLLATDVYYAPFPLVWANRFSVSENRWQGDVLIANCTSLNCYASQLIPTGTDGDMLAIWADSGASRYQINATPYTWIGDTFPNPNGLPMVYAGPHLWEIPPGTPITLTATASDPDGSIVSYAWTQESGPPVTLTGANTPTVRFTTPEVLDMDYITLKITVTDNQGATRHDSVDIEVFAP